MSLNLLFFKYSFLIASYNPCRCSLLRCERLRGFVLLHSSAVPNRSETDVIGEQRLLALMNASASGGGESLLVDLGCSLLSAIGLLGLSLLGCGSGFGHRKIFVNSYMEVYFGKS